MAIQPTNISAFRRSIKLRRDLKSQSECHDLTLSALGNAAARETCLTATPHMAAIWTDLFQSMTAPGSELRWCGDGPGIGRDARIAYSSLLGRYMARAYLTEHEGVHVLVPLDVAKRRLKGTGYCIQKDPPGRGLEADWIGLDDSKLVIVEAKGSFDEGYRTWKGPNSRPQILETAIAQAERTAVFACHPRRKLPAKRWAIASRWGTENNQCEPTLLAWDPEEENLGEDDYQALAKVLRQADLDGVMRGLGHLEVEQVLGTTELSEHAPGVLRIHVGDQSLEWGFSAIAGPFGVKPLRSKEDFGQVQRLRELNLSYAVASLASRYFMTVIREHRWLDEERTASERSASRAGLTVVWPEDGEDVVLAE